MCTFKFACIWLSTCQRWNWNGEGTLQIFNCSEEGRSYLSLFSLDCAVMSLTGGRIVCWFWNDGRTQVSEQGSVNNKKLREGNRRGNRESTIKRVFPGHCAEFLLTSWLWTKRCDDRVSRKGGELLAVALQNGIMRMDRKDSLSRYINYNLLGGGGGWDTDPPRGCCCLCCLLKGRILWWAGGGMNYSASDEEVCEFLLVDHPGEVADSPPCGCSHGWQRTWIMNWSHTKGNERVVCGGGFNEGLLIMVSLVSLAGRKTAASNWNDVKDDFYGHIHRHFMGWRRRGAE